MSMYMYVYICAYTCICIYIYLCTPPAPRSFPCASVFGNTTVPLSPTTYLCIHLYMYINRVNPCVTL